MMLLALTTWGMVTFGADGHFAFANGNGRKGSALVEAGRSKAAAPDERELEGVIRSAGEESVVVYTSHKEEVSIGLSGDTVIRRGNEPLSAADLVADMRVQVRARKVTEGYVAQQIVAGEEMNTILATEVEIRGKSGRP